MDHQELVRQVVKIAINAAEKILTVSKKQKIEVSLKEDNSPLTQADEAANEAILFGLQSLGLEHPILSEESGEVSDEIRQSWQSYWLVDPLDGTKDFIKGTGDYTVNIALIDHGRAVLGVVVVPESGEVYYAYDDGGAFKQVGTHIEQIHTRQCQDPLKVLISRHHSRDKLEDLLSSIPNIEFIARGSSLKICSIAEGQADYYPRLGPTSDWDLAAAHCIIREAGGELLNFKGEPLTYNRPEGLIQPPFIALGDQASAWQDFVKHLEKAK